MGTVTKLYVEDPLTGQPRRAIKCLPMYMAIDRWGYAHTSRETRALAEADIPDLTQRRPNCTPFTVVEF